MSCKNLTRRSRDGGIECESLAFSALSASRVRFWADLGGQSAIRRSISRVLIWSKFAWSSKIRTRARQYETGVLSVLSTEVVELPSGTPHSMAAQSESRSLRMLPRQASIRIQAADAEHEYVSLESKRPPWLRSVWIAKR